LIRLLGGSVPDFKSETGVEPPVEAGVDRRSVDLSIEAERLESKPFYGDLAMFSLSRDEEAASHLYYRAASGLLALRSLRNS
jgi:hypothetical protein